MIVYPLLFGFLLINLPITMKYMGKTEEVADQPPPHTQP
jgi:hypothetical protein